MHLAIDSTGKTNGSRAKDYTLSVLGSVKKSANVDLVVSYAPGADLPELKNAIAGMRGADAHLLISMCNYGVKTISRKGVDGYMYQACDELKALDKPGRPIKIYYGGPGEMWKAAATAPHNFEEKAQAIREYLRGLGMDVDSGKDAYRSQFCAADLDASGHFLGRLCRDRCEHWLATLVLWFSYEVWVQRSSGASTAPAGAPAWDTESC